MGSVSFFRATVSQQSSFKAGSPLLHCLDLPSMRDRRNELHFLWLWKEVLIIVPPSCPLSHSHLLV